MVRIPSQANAHQRTATSEAQENSRKILKTRQKPCLISQRNHAQTTENTSQTTISTTVLPCNCRKYCPAVKSTKLEVSYRRLFSYMLMHEVVYWRNATWVAVELYFLGQNVRQDKRVNNLNLVVNRFGHIETVEKSLSEKVSLGVQKILDRERSPFFPRSHARREKK